MRGRRAYGNRVRIIGGQYRRRMLAFPDHAGLRPTPDRVRETLFNWLGQTLEGWRCLDLFAGSGALGFEAASRGAAEVVMIERDPAVVRALRSNRQMLDAEAVEIVEADALAWLERDCRAWDLVFVDPPFASGLSGVVLPLLASRLARGGAVYVEQATPVTAPPGWRLCRSGRAGQSCHALLEHTGEETC